MYESIQGILTELNPAKIVIETHGIGYNILIPLHMYTDLLASIGQPIKCFLSYVVREDSQRFFGFLKKTDRDTFEMLSDVSGIGPKTALSIIGHMPLKELVSAIQSQDILTLSKIPGIGKKTAERLILEIKDKLKSLIVDSSAIEHLPKEHLILVNDAVSALVNLGYPHNIAQQTTKTVLKTHPGAIKLAELITLSLKKLRIKD